jgi:phenylpropionate dioxygenase-like ring-hydroxylating dioxygenase large terminal subunit
MLSAEPDRAAQVVDDVYVDAARYYERSFFDLESLKLWPHTWQPACRLEEIPAPGDFIEYRIVDRSILVVRQPDGSVKAFENACRHRATALGTDCGTFHGGQIVCPYHGWRFDLDGACSYVYAERGFRPDTITADRLRLVECAVAERWGYVWICMDLNGPSFQQFAGSELPQILDGIGLDTARTNWWRSIRIEANWKIALEAFLEAYHIAQTHPELAPDTIDDDYDADAFAYEVDVEQGHGWLTTTDTPPLSTMSGAATMMLNNRVLISGVDGWITDEQFDAMEQLWSSVPATLSEDQFIEQFFGTVYARAATAGAELPPVPTLGLGYIFPNMALINNLGNSLIYRFRPDGNDAEACIWEIWSVSVAAQDAPLTRPQLERLESLDQLPPVYQQDASNMELQQRGIHSGGFTASTYSPRYEKMIPNMHHQIDRYLAR